MILDAETPPPGYKPGQTRAPLIWDITVPLGVIAVFLACLRFYVRTYLVGTFGKDDWLLLAAVVFLCGLVGSALWGAALGCGRHQYDLDRETDPRKIIPSGTITLLCYNLCQCCVQCSILAFYLRLELAKVHGNCIRYTIYALMGFSVVNNTVAACLQLVFTMVESLLVQSKKYLTASFFTYGSLHLLMDLIIWFIPLPSIYSVMHNLSTRKKVFLTMVFGLGIMSWGSAILRISFRGYVEGMGADPTYNAPIFIVLYVTEISLAIICVSVVTFQPLGAKMSKGFNRLKGKPTSTNTSATSANQFGASPGGAQPEGYGFSTRGPKTRGRGAEFEGQMTVGHELVEYKDDVLDIEPAHFALKTCGCKYGDGDVEFGGIRVHASLCPACPDPPRGTQIQDPAPATTGCSATHDSPRHFSGETIRTTNLGSALFQSSQPTCDTLLSPESPVSLTNTNTNSLTDYPRPVNLV